MKEKSKSRKFSQCLAILGRGVRLWAHWAKGGEAGLKERCSIWGLRGRAQRQQDGGVEMDHETSVGPFGLEKICLMTSSPGTYKIPIVRKTLFRKWQLQKASQTVRCK